jgi:hypothetical protein
MALGGKIEDDAQLDDQKAGKSKKEKYHEMRPGPGDAQILRQPRLGRI